MYKNPTKFEKILLCTILFGIALRIISFWTREIMDDASIYSAMGHSFLNNLEFIEPWPTGVGEYFQVYPPMYPIYLSAFYSLLGFSAEVTRCASIISAILLIGVVYFTTKDLYGRQKGLVCTAVVALMHHLIHFGAIGYAENLNMIFFTIVVWAFIKGIETKPVYLLLAGFFAGLSYLTKATWGYFFGIAVIILACWVVYYAKLKLIKIKYFVAPACIFLALFLIWSFRNITRFGWPHFETSPEMPMLSYCLFDVPGQFLFVIVAKIPFFVLLLLMIGLFWLPELKKSLEKIKTIHYSALWLVLFLIAFVSLLYASEVCVYQQRPIYWTDNIRYTLTAIVPLLWLAVKDANFDTAFNLRKCVNELYENLKKRKRLLLFAAAILICLIGYLMAGFFFLVYLLPASVALLFGASKVRLVVLVSAFCIISSTAFIATYEKTAAAKASQELNKILQPNDVVAVEPSGIYMYRFYPFLESRHKIKLIEFKENCSADYIISWLDRTYEGYKLIGVYEGELHCLLPYPLGKPDKVWLWYKSS